MIYIPKKSCHISFLPIRTFYFYKETHKIGHFWSLSHFTSIMKQRKLVFWGSKPFYPLRGKKGLTYLEHQCSSF